MIVIEVIVSGDGDLRPRLQAPWQCCLGSKKTGRFGKGLWVANPKRVGWFGWVGWLVWFGLGLVVWVGFVGLGWVGLVKLLHLPTQYDH